VLPSDRKSLLRFGFSDDDFADGGSDALIDRMYVWGSEDAVVKRLRKHLDAGADHVALCVMQGAACERVAPSGVDPPTTPRDPACPPRTIAARAPGALVTDADIRGKTIAVLGGTGPQGRGLARRFALAGLTVVLGSRAADKAEKAAAELAVSTGGAVSGAGNADAAAAGDLVLVVVPWEGHAQLLRDLKPRLDGKIVVDCVNPLGFDRQGAYALVVEEGSATQQAAVILTDSTVVGAFHNVSAVLLGDPEVESVETDVLVLGDEREATDLVQSLADVVPGMRGVYAGRRRNAHQVEALTANLLSINRRYKAHAGVRITDV
jgi:8-hydroxy-5-deazaflavin:NADPH oxidoreductase